MVFVSGKRAVAHLEKQSQEIEWGINEGAQEINMYFAHRAKGKGSFFANDGKGETGYKLYGITRQTRAGYLTGL